MGNGVRDVVNERNYILSSKRLSGFDREIVVNTLPVQNETRDVKCFAFSISNESTLFFISEILFTIVRRNNLKLAVSF